MCLSLHKLCIRLACKSNSISYF